MFFDSAYDVTNSTDPGWGHTVPGPLKIFY